MRTRRILQIRKAQGEEKREKHLTTGRFLEVQAEKRKRKGKQKTTNQAVKTERQGGILRKKTRTNITKVSPKKELDPKV